MRNVGSKETAEMMRRWQEQADRIRREQVPESKDKQQGRLAVDDKN